MNLWLRLCWVFFRSYFGKRLALLDESVLRLRVLPNDLDVYRHMNNSRYLTLMDLGRMDLVWRSPLGRVAAANRWFPLVASVSIRYRKSLKLFQPYNLKTRIVSWDDKWLFLEQSFERKGRVFAVASVKGLFRGSHGNIPTARILKEIGLELPLTPPALPPTNI